MSLPGGGLVPVKPGSARHSIGQIGVVGGSSSNLSNSMNAQNSPRGGGHHSSSQQQQAAVVPSFARKSLTGGGGGEGQVPSSLPPASSSASGGVPTMTSSSSSRGNVPDERQLTAYEREELKTFDHGIYYSGENCASKIQAPTTGPNYGFDDERGDYVLHNGDHIRFRYEIQKILGRGSFGQVACCIDHKTGSQIALKIIRNKKRFHQQAQVEIRVLAHLRDRDPDGKYGIVRFLDSFVCRSHVCITYELLSMNLFEYIKFNKFRPLPLNVVKKIGASVLISLAFMSRENIVHCDLKPENILLRQPNRTGVKVIDLGSACFENERLYTYIQSRFYRAPEVILGIPYTRKIDLWSFACVLCELAVGYPVFPGESEVDQLACMMEFLGVPPKHVLDEAPRRSVFFDIVDGNYSPKLVPNSRKKIRHPNTKALHKFLGLEEDHLFVHFISMFFRWDPSERPHAEPAMRHPWICDAYVGVTPKMPYVHGLPIPSGYTGAVASAPGAASSSSGGGGGHHHHSHTHSHSSSGSKAASASAAQSSASSSSHHHHRSSNAGQGQQQQQQMGSSVNSGGGSTQQSSGGGGDDTTSARKHVLDNSARGAGGGDNSMLPPGSARNPTNYGGSSTNAGNSMNNSSGVNTMFPSITTPRHAQNATHGTV